MKLKEYIAANADKEIEIQEDGTIRILKEKGPWKPETGKSYYVISSTNDVRILRWFDDEIDKRKLDMGSVFQTESEAERAVHRLKARKKFLDAGGHEGIEGYGEFRKYTHKPMLGVFLQIDGTLVVHELNGISAFMIWFESREDCEKAIDSLTEDEIKALCWTGDRQ